MHTYDILIVGGGLAGLGCARTLQKNGHKDFCLVTDVIGGRAPVSGRDAFSSAFYARNDYLHLKPFLSLGRKATIWKGRLITETKMWRPYAIALRHPFRMLRFLYFIWTFDRRYQKFMRRNESMSQKESMEQDPILLKLYHQSANDFLEEHDLEPLGTVLISTLVRVTRFVSLDEASAFLMLWIWLLLIRRAHECTVDIAKMSSDLYSSITLDRVCSITKKEDQWIMKTNSGNTLAARRLVLATPITITLALLGVTSPTRTALNVYMAKVSGTPKSRYIAGRYNVFPFSNPDVAIVDGEDGTYELFSLRSDFDLSVYFENYSILHTKQWQPATFAGSGLQSTDMGEHLFIIGDANFPCMEAAYVSGISLGRALMRSV